jgi:hypothetical protein
MIYQTIEKPKRGWAIPPNLTNMKKPGQVSPAIWRSANSTVFLEGAGSTSRMRLSTATPTASRL